MLRSEVLALFPTQARVERALREAAERGARDGVGVALGARVMTFPALFEALYLESGAPRKEIGEAGRYLLARRAAETYLRGARHFAGQRRFKGFVTELLRLSDLLRRALITAPRTPASAPADAYRAVMTAGPPGPAGRPGGDASTKKEIYSADAGDAASGGDGDPGRYAELADLLDRYEDRLAAGGWIDRAGLEVEALRYLREHRDVPFLHGVRRIVVEDFHDLTPVQFHLLLALAGRVESAEVRLPYNPDRQDAYRFVGEFTLKHFEGLGGEGIASKFDPCFKYRERAAGRESARPPVAGGEGTPSRLGPGGDAGGGAAGAVRALDHVLEHIFKDVAARAKAGRCPADDSLRVISAPGRAREVEEIAREVRKRIAAGTPPEAIAVIFRTIGDDARLVEETFRRFRVGISFRRGLPLFSAGPARALARLLDAARSPGFLRTPDFLAVAGSPYFDFPVRSEGVCVPPEKIPALLAAAGILDGPLDDWRGRLDKAVARKAVDAAEAAAVASAAGRMAALLEALAEPRTLPAHAAFVRGLLRDLRVRDRACAAPDAALLRRDLEAIETIEAVLEDCAEAGRALDRPETVPFESFAELFFHAASAASLPGTPGLRGAVPVISAPEAAGLEFDHVFIGGLQEGEFPLLHRAPPLLPDHEAVRFRDAVTGVPLFRTARFSQWEEPLLFCLALSAARKSATLSYSALDEKGGAAVRSHFIDEVRFLVSGDLERVIGADALVPAVEEAMDPRGLAEAVTLACWARPVEEAGAAQAVYARLLQVPPRRAAVPDLRRVFLLGGMEAAREEFLREPDSALRAARAGPENGRLDAARFGPLLRRLLFDRRGGRPAAWSASELEILGNCGFAWMMERLLGLEDPEAARAEADASVVGTAAHDALERFYRALAERRMLPLLDAEKAMPLLERAVADAFTKVEAEGRAGDGIFWSIRREEVLAALRHSVEEEAARNRWDAEQGGIRFVPVAFEKKFGMGEPFFEADLPGIGRVRFQGKIDRVDAGPAGLRVVDYKFSRDIGKFRRAVEAERLGTLSFQLPLYLLAASADFPEEAAKGRAAAMFLLRAADLREASIAPTLLDGTGPDSFLGRAADVLRRALEGQFDVSPGECPPLCPFRNACRYFVPGGADEEE